MTKELTPDEKAERGRKADLLMGDPVMLDAFGSVRSQLLEALALASVRDIEGIQLAQAQIKVVDKVVSLLHDWIRGGEAAEADIEREIRKNEEERLRLEREQEGYAARGMQRLRSLAGSKR